MRSKTTASSRTRASLRRTRGSGSSRANAAFIAGSLSRTSAIRRAARQRARERLATVWAQRAERDRRIEDAVTAGLAAADERVAVDRRRDLAVEAARLAMVEA